MKFKNFLSFERMITPIIIKILFYVGLIGSLIGGIVFFFSTAFIGLQWKSFSQILWGFLLGALGGLLIMFLGALVTRIYAELLILIFRINETLTDIKTLLQEK
jgi:ABC-type transport system involved in cytochrome c biogenesis permease subunit